MSRFARHLEKRGLTLRRKETTTLQVNVGLLCNMCCRHCHLAAGPERTEVMGRDTAERVVDLARRFSFAVIDLTGGAPEMNPHIEFLLRSLAPLTSRLVMRSNLTALAGGARSRLMALCRDLGVVLVASFPSVNECQLEAQRGRGAFSASVTALRRLNELGYGRRDSGLELNLVSNPAGAFLPGGQRAMEDRFRQVLRAKFGIEFNNLYAFANMPLGRFGRWLEQSGNMERYIDNLVARFNPCAVDSVMCRELISVSWDGQLHDCDFNLAAGLPLGAGKGAAADLERLPGPGDPIALGDHCFACTAGAGFS